MGACWARGVRVFSRHTFVEFWRKHPDAEQPLRLWFAMVERAAWAGPADARKVFRSADFVANNRVVFDIKGNTYRLIARIKYGPLSLVFIRFVAAVVVDEAWRDSRRSAD